MCGRGTHEKVYGELKGGFAFDCLPTQRYQANSAWQVFSIIAFNLMRAMQAGTTERWSTNRKQRTIRPFQTIETLRNGFINRARLLVQPETASTDEASREGARLNHLRRKERLMSKATTYLKAAALAVCLALLLPAGAFADADQKAARQLILDCVNLLREADVHPGAKDATEPFLDLLRQAQAKLHEVAEKYPTTEEGMALAMGRTIPGIAVGGMNFDLSLAIIDEVVRSQTGRGYREACLSRRLPHTHPACQHSVTAIVARMHNDGLYEEGRQLALSIEDPHEQALAFTNIINHYLYKKDHASAFENYFHYQAALAGLVDEADPMYMHVSFLRQMALMALDQKDFGAADAYVAAMPETQAKENMIKIVQTRKDAN